MKNVIFTITIASLLLTIGACNKNGLPPVSHKSEMPDSAVDVYVSGSVVNQNNKLQAVYWKNGVLNKMGDSSYYSLGRSIAVAGNDVYVTGYKYSTLISNNIAVYWKNGIATNLGNGSNNSEAYGIAIQGNDVFIVGSDFNTATNTFEAVLWKNGVAAVLPGGTTASAVAVNGADVYVTGTTGSGNSLTAVYWKNGIASALPGGLQANAIAIKGNDVYIAGNMGNYAAGYWKNGVPALLSNTAVPQEFGYDVRGIATNGTDVYIAGSTMFTSAADSAYANSAGIVATLWKNSSPATFSANTLNNSGNAVFLYGTDVYFTTSGVNNGAGLFVSNYYKNSTAFQLSSGDAKGASPSGIVVVPR